MLIDCSYRPQQLLYGLINSDSENKNTDSNWPIKHHSVFGLHFFWIEIQQ